MGLLAVDIESLTAFAIQEAYQNDDGTFADPHWDEWCPVNSHAIDRSELKDHLKAIGNWTEAFHNRDDDPRRAFRRVAAIRLAEPAPEPTALDDLFAIADDLEVRVLWGSAGVFVRSVSIPLMTCATSDTAGAVIEAIQKAKAARE